MTQDEYRAVLRTALYAAAQSLEDPEPECAHPLSTCERVDGVTMTADAIPVRCVCGEERAVPMDEWEEHIDGSSKR